MPGQAVVRQAWVGPQEGTQLWDHLPGPMSGRSLRDPESLSWGRGWEGNMGLTLGISSEASALWPPRLTLTPCSLHHPDLQY